MAGSGAGVKRKTLERSGAFYCLGQFGSNHARILKNWDRFGTEGRYSGKIEKGPNSLIPIYSIKSGACGGNRTRTATRTEGF